MSSITSMDNHHSPSMPKASKLEYFKCTQCRKDRQKCVPRERPWPGVKCDRCIKYGYACSANVSKSGEEPPVYRRGGGGGSHGNSSSSSSRAMIPPAIYTTGPVIPTLPSTTLPEYLADPALYAATLSMASSHITPTHRVPLSRSHSDYGFAQQTLLTPPSIAFDWLVSLDFTSYVYGYTYLSPENHDGIIRLYRSLDKRKTSMARHSMNEMTDQVDNFYEEVSRSQRRSSSLSSSQWNYQQGNSRGMPSNPIAHEDKRGARWQSLVDTLSPEILLIDPHASNAFLSTLEHANDDDFELAKAHVCSPGSRTWEICLKLTGVHKMIEDLEEGKSNLALEVRKWIAGEIQRRVQDAISPVYSGSARGSVQSLHSDIGVPLE